MPKHTRAEALRDLGGSSTMNAATATSFDSATSHDDYQPMLTTIRQHFAVMLSTYGGPLFTTNIEGRDLWDVWLAHLPAHERQHHNCHACRRFVERYGGLVFISADGNAHPAIPFSSSGIYEKSFRAVARALAHGRITGVFVSSESVWGTPSTRDGRRHTTWHHMHIVPPDALRYRGTVMTADQRAAELAEDYATLCRALADFKIETLLQALQLAQSESLYRSEKIEGRLKWLVDLHERRTVAHGSARDNITWRAVATAPAGFCHVRSSVIGSLLEDIEAGKPFEAVKRAFDEKMNPLKYQRPTAPPSAGNIRQAEAIVDKLGSAGALRRRFARLEELQTIWRPAPVKVPPSGGGAVFGHLLHTPKTPSMVATGATMTWSKFARTVLPHAEKIEVDAPTRGNYTALVTAADPDATPILQWDRADSRNPVSWYTYATGSPARQWNVAPGYVEVTGMTHMPNMWQEGFKHHGEGVLLVLKDCRDLESTRAGLCLFPELLKSEYHGIRATIEAFSRGKEIEDVELASACGLTIRAGGRQSPVRVRVHSLGTVTEYTVDRWD